MASGRGGGIRTHGAGDYDAMFPVSYDIGNRRILRDGTPTARRSTRTGIPRPAKHGSSRHGRSSPKDTNGSSGADAVRGKPAGGPGAARAPDAPRDPALCASGRRTTRGYPSLPRGEPIVEAAPGGAMQLRRRIAEKASDRIPDKPTIRQRRPLAG